MVPLATPNHILCFHRIFQRNQSDDSFPRIQLTGQLGLSRKCYGYQPETMEIQCQPLPKTRVDRTYIVRPSASLHGCGQKSEPGIIFLFIGPSHVAMGPHKKVTYLSLAGSDGLCPLLVLSDGLF